MPNYKNIRIFSALEVARLCGVVNQTAINWIKNGKLNAFMTPGGQYRVYADDLVRFLEEKNLKLPDKIDSILNIYINWKAILVVDDDESLNHLFKRFLVKRFPDFNIFQAFDGFEAGRLLAEEHPGFVFLDIDLPGIHGFELCGRIKNDLNFGKPFIIAMTGLDEKGVKDRILKSGADAFFTKPLVFSALVELVEDFSRKVNGEYGEKTNNSGC